MDTEVLAILDMSASMGGIGNPKGGLYQATIDGFNTWLTETAAGQQQGDDVRITVTTFDTLVETHVDRVAIKACPKLGTDLNPYLPRGNTALLDAVGITLTKVKEFVPNGKRALVMIITDGDENSSRTWNHAKLGDLMKELEATGRYSFLYMGAGVDSWAQAQSYGDTSGFATRSASYARHAHGAAFASAGSSGFGYMADSSRVQNNNLGAEVTAGIKGDGQQHDTEADKAKTTTS